MLIDFDAIPEIITHQMRGGEKSVATQTYADQLCKIIRGRLIPGASVGFHKHETDSEVIYILSGQGKVLYDDTCEVLTEGSCHYCPNGHSHGLLNDSNADLEYLAVIPTHQT